MCRCDKYQLANLLITIFLICDMAYGQAHDVQDTDTTMTDVLSAFDKWADQMKYPINWHDKTISMKKSLFKETFTKNPLNTSNSIPIGTSKKDTLCNIPIGYNRLIIPPRINNTIYKDGNTYTTRPLPPMTTFVIYDAWYIIIEHDPVSTVGMSEDVISDIAFEFKKMSDICERAKARIKYMSDLDARLSSIEHGWSDVIEQSSDAADAMTRAALYATRFTSRGVEQALYFNEGNRVVILFWEGTYGSAHIYMIEVYEYEKMLYRIWIGIIQDQIKTIDNKHDDIDASLLNTVCVAIQCGLQNQVSSDIGSICGDDIFSDKNRQCDYDMHILPMYPGSKHGKGW
jgi:hypothetical protein